MLFDGTVTEAWAQLTKQRGFELIQTTLEVRQELHDGGFRTSWWEQRM